MSLPEWWTRDRESRNARSRRQETRHARATGGKVQAGSGSSWRAKQDVKSSDHLDQLKFTDRDSYRLTASELLTIEADALRDGRDGRLIIEFSNHDLTVIVQRYEGD